MFNALKHYDATHQILMGYMDYYYRFKLITKRARIRFEQRDWHGIQDDAKGRIDLYRYQGHATISYDYDLGTRDLTDILTELLGHFQFAADWDDQKADVQLVANRWQHHIDLLGGRSPKDRLEVLTSLFYRNKSAYIVGRFLKDDSVQPFIRWRKAFWNPAVTGK